MLTRSLFNLTPWPYRRFFDELDRMKTAFNPNAAGVFPSINVTEDQDKIYVRAELPGLKADEIDISATANSLAISGERKIATEENGVKYHRREREAGKFSRIFDLPVPVDTKTVDARMVNGILTIALSKAQAGKPRKIAVK